MTVENKEDAVVEPTAEEKAYADAVAMGDIIPEPVEDKLDADVLAEIAGEPVPAEQKKEDHVIPKARFDELATENKALKELLAKAEAAKPENNNAIDFDAIEAQRMDLQLKADELLLEGNTEDRKPLLQEIRKIDKYLAKAEAILDIDSKIKEQKTNESMSVVIASAYELYPFLNNESDTFDNDAVTLINLEQKKYMDQGYDAANALKLAVQDKAPKFAKLNGITDNDTNKADAVRQERAKTEKQKAAAASLSQPASLPSKSDRDSFKVNVAGLSAAQIKAMPEDQKAILRGDV